MGIFGDRERAFEQIFANNEAVTFRALVLRNHMLAEWAADRIGLTGKLRKDYIDGLTQSAIALLEDAPFLVKIMGDLEAHGAPATEELVRSKMADFLTAATEQLRGKSA